MAPLDVFSGSTEHRRRNGSLTALSHKAIDRLCNSLPIRPRLGLDRRITDCVVRNNTHGSHPVFIALRPMCAQGHMNSRQERPHSHKGGISAVTFIGFLYDYARRPLEFLHEW